MHAKKWLNDSFPKNCVEWRLSLNIELLSFCNNQTWYVIWHDMIYMHELIHIYYNKQILVYDNGYAIIPLYVCLYHYTIYWWLYYIIWFAHIYVYQYHYHNLCYIYTLIYFGVAIQLNRQAFIYECSLTIHVYTIIIISYYHTYYFLMIYGIIIIICIWLRSYEAIIQMMTLPSFSQKHKSAHWSLIINHISIYVTILLMVWYYYYMMAVWRFYTNRFGVHHITLFPVFPPFRTINIYIILLTWYIIYNHNGACAMLIWWHYNDESSTLVFAAARPLLIVVLFLCCSGKTNRYIIIIISI